MSIQLIVGLANPGKEYTDTRHNAGAWWVESLAQQEKISLRTQAKFHGLYSVFSKEAHTCHLLIPTTFMNLSGQALVACARFYKIPHQHILVAHDDIDLPVGVVKLKYDGGDGGHNGLKDIIRHLNTKQFYRLRIGVGRPKSATDVVDYVLTPPSKSERKAIDQALSKADTIMDFLLNGEMQRAMQQLHTISGE